MDDLVDFNSDADDSLIRLVVSHSEVFNRLYINMALNIRDCVSLVFRLDEILCGVGPFYLVSMPGEVKYPTQGVIA